MTTAALQQQPTPERFFNAINAHELTEAIKTAVELEIFTAIAEGNTTAAMIAERCEAAERSVRILCDFLTIHSFLTKEGARYGLAPDSALFLNRHSPAYAGTATQFLPTQRLRECHAQLTESVRRGGTALSEGVLEPESPDWVKFAHGRFRCGVSRPTKSSRKRAKRRARQTSCPIASTGWNRVEPASARAT